MTERTGNEDILGAEGGVEEGDGVFGGAAGGVVDLVAATGAGGGDGVGGGGGADTGEEDEFAYFLGEVVVFFLVAKGAGRGRRGRG